MALSSLHRDALHGPRNVIPNGGCDEQSFRGTAVASPSRSFETLSDAWAKAFSYIEKLTELNLRAFKSTLAENQAVANAAVSTHDTQALYALQARRAQAVVEEAQSYWRHVYNITSSVQVDLAASVEARFRQRQRDVQAMVDAVANSAPVGSEAAVNALQSAVTTASEATRATIEASKKAAQRALEIAEKNANAVASASARAATQAVEQAGVVTKK